MQDVPPPIEPGDAPALTPGSVRKRGRWIRQDVFATAASGAGAAMGSWPACREVEARLTRLHLRGAQAALLFEGAEQSDDDNVVDHVGQPTHGSRCRRRHNAGLIT